MASPKTALETVEEVAAVAEAVVAPTIVAPLTRRARVKGTWTMYFGGEQFDFVDGQFYELRPDLFEYLRGSGNIYDTLA
jgi:hypothetical protein